MSLLIKALDKAQAEKAAAKKNADSAAPNVNQSKLNQASDKPTKQPSIEGLSLSPPEENLTSAQSKKVEQDALPKVLKDSAAGARDAREETPLDNVRRDQTIQSTPSESSRSQAANVFMVKQTTPSKQKVVIASLIGLLALMLLAGFAYWYQFVFNVPEIVIPPRPALTQTKPAPLPEAVVAEQPSNNVQQENVEIVESDVFGQKDVVVALKDKPIQEEKPVNKVEQDAPTATDLADKPVVNELKQTLAPNESVVALTEINDATLSAETSTIEIKKSQSESDVNPILMRAYAAYQAGDDNQAQADYKRVLQRYGSNVDAMLGLGAISARQGRIADANDWYRKVLEVEPRNEVAQAGLLSIQQKTQPQSNESNIKSMLAVSPNDANLHAALGNLYASRGQWSAAQQAYFDAYRYYPSGENAFNLGVSLDQLGKPKLALPYYQEALQKADQSSLIDTAALQARISSIQ